MDVICLQGAATSLVGTSQGIAGGLKLGSVPVAASLKKRSASVSQKTARVSGKGQGGLGLLIPPYEPERKLQESNCNPVDQACLSTSQDVFECGSTQILKPL